MHIAGISGLDQSAPYKRARWPGLEARAYRIAQGGDSAAALVRNGEVLFAAAEERFSREKTTGAFPVQALRAALRHARLDPRDLDLVAHCFDYRPYAPLFDWDPDLRDQFQKVFDPRLQVELLERHFPGVDWERRFVPVPHHLAHAASAFYPSGFERALVVVSDGMGEAESLSVFAAAGNRFDLLASAPALHSLGVLYGVFTLYLGFDFGMDEYKVMGLAPYGNRRRFHDALMELIELKEDGGYVIPVFGRNATPEARETQAGVIAELEERFGPARAPGEEMTERFRDVAAAVQSSFETVQMHVLTTFARQTGLENLCLAGGTALNGTANGLIRRSGLFQRVFVQPASGDDGAALGAALHVQHAREPWTPPRPLVTPLWGPEFTREQIRSLLDARSDAQAVESPSPETLVAETAERLDRGEILGWFQGRMEFGPRALGSRSILADPRPADMRARINHLVKKREGFRPFAPAVAAERAAEFFDLAPGGESDCAHMLFVVPVREPWRERLPAVTHVDGSARLQTVAQNANPRFHALLTAFGQRTGLPILLNTSFNVKGQPIVCTPAEALDTALSAGLDAVVLGDFLVTARRE